MIKKFDKPTLKHLRTEINQALEQLAVHHGISIHAGSGSFSDNAATFKLELALTAEDGNTLTREAEAFKQNAELFGLRPEWLFREFQYGADTLKLIGLNMRAPKLPLLIEKGGRKFKYPEGFKDVIKLKLGDQS